MPDIDRKPPKDINLDTVEYKVRGEDGKYRMRPDRGLNRIGSIVALVAVAGFYFWYLRDIVPIEVAGVLVIGGFLAGAMFTLSLKHIDW